MELNEDFVGKDEKNESDDDIIQEFKKRASRSYDFQSKNFASYKFDTEFLWVNQWDNKDQKSFKRYNKKALEAPKLDAYARNIMGELRQNRPDLEVGRVFDDAPDVLDDQFSESIDKSVNLNQMIVRSITDTPEAEIAKDVAAECAMSGGFGVLKVIADYENANSFNQTLFMKPAKDPLKFGFDPSAQEDSKRDGMYAFEVVKISKEEFRQRYPGKSYPKVEAIPGMDDNWVADHSLHIAIYQRKKFFKKKLYQMQDGSVLTKQQYKEMILSKKEELQLSGVPDEQINMLLKGTQGGILPIAEREADDYIIEVFKIAGNEILEKTEWVSKWFGYIYVPLNPHIIDGQELTRSFFKSAQNIQQSINYTFTQLMYLMKTTQNTRFMVAKEQLSVLEASDLEAWKNPERVRGALVYGNVPGILPPIVVEPQPINQSIVNMYQMLNADLQTTLGLYDSFKGDTSGDMSRFTSGAGISQSNKSTFIIHSALNRGLAQAGEVILSAIPKVFNTRRILNLKNDDGRTSPFLINDGSNDIEEGNYYIKIDAAVSFEKQRQEASARMVQFLSMNPQSYNLLADMAAKTILMGTDARIAASRLKTIIPPDVISAGEGKSPEPKQPEGPPPEMQIMMQQMENEKMRTQSMLEIENKKLQAKTLEMEAKIMQAKMDDELKREQMNNDNSKSLMELQFKYDELGTQASLKQSSHMDKLVNQTLRQSDKLFGA